jgi:hypothetical protein
MVIASRRMFRVTSRIPARISTVFLENIAPV